MIDQKKKERLIKRGRNDKSKEEGTIDQRKKELLIERGRND